MVAVPCFLAAAYMADRAGEASEVSAARGLDEGDRPREALDAARRAPATPPGVEALMLEARALTRLGRDDAAARAYRRAAQREPTDWMIRRDLAVVLARAGDRSAARAEMARALALNPRMTLPFGFARRKDLRAVRREQRRAARAAAAASALQP